MNNSKLNFIPENESEWNSPEESEECPLLDIITEVLEERPLGMEWDYEKKIKFIKGKGWKIVTRKREEDGVEYDVAINPGQSASKLPNFSNVSEVFIDLIQDSIIDFLLKQHKENE